MSLTFYYSPQSSASPVHWALEELGIPYEKVVIDLKKGEQKSPEFLKINPNGKVPVIVHDGVVIFESAAIQIYLGETFGVQKGLYPEPGPRRGEVMKWIVWTNVTLGDGLWRYGRNVGNWVPEDERNAKAGASALADVNACLKILEQQLTGKSYVTGEEFTMADIHMASWLEYVGMLGIDLKPYPVITDWAKRCTSRPAYKIGD